MIAMPYVIKYISMIMHYFVENWIRKNTGFWTTKILYYIRHFS